MNEYLDRTDSFIASLGVEAYRVGGSVRDEILGQRAKDADYVVRGLGLKALAAELTRDAGRCVISPLKLRDGRQSGWRVSGRGLGCIEIVLPRTEVSTGPAHRDFKIELDPNLSLVEDAKRRDFTFNALYRPVGAPAGDFLYQDIGEWSEEHGAVLDPTGRGLDDLRRKRVNVTHPDSFRDDPVRILRALRFVSTLDYELGSETRALMTLHADAATGLTAGGTSGTVYEELCKMLMGQCPAKALRLARDTGVLAVAFPELADMIGFEQGSRYHDMTTDEHTFTALETAANVDAPLRVRLALLFHDAGKPQAAWIGEDGRKHYYGQDGTRRVGMGVVGSAYGQPTEDHEIVGARIWMAAARRLNVPKRVREDVARLIREHMVRCERANPTKVRRERVRLGDELLRDLYLMRMCDLSGKGNKNAKFLLNIASMEGARAIAEARGVPRSPRDLQITGHDVVEITGGKFDKVGDVLRGVLDEVVVDPSEQKLTREWQLSAARRLA